MKKTFFSLFLLTGEFFIHLVTKISSDTGVLKAKYMYVKGILVMYMLHWSNMIKLDSQYFFCLLALIHE